MDVLSDVLENLRLRSRVMAQTDLVAPWGIRAEPSHDFAFHIVSRGRCWFEVDGREPTWVASGDVLVLAPGRGHTLRDDPASPARPLEELVASGAFARAPISPAPDPRATHLVCGRFQIDSLGGEVLRSALPTVIHSGDLAADVGPWIAQTLRLLANEAAGAAPGKATVVNRLCDALFVYVLRSHLASAAPGEPSWLRGLVDPEVARALELMHGDPGRAWTVASLAQAVGMSRSAFAARFQEVVGQSPIKYLAGWRLQRAAALLRREDVGIAELAARHGYESEAAFSKAFKRGIGVAPGAYRQAARVARAQGHRA